MPISSYNSLPSPSNDRSLHEIPELRNIIQEFLQILITNLLLQARYQRLRLFRSFAT